MSDSRATPHRRVERATSLRSGRPLEQFPGARSCVVPGCEVRLSRYNPNATCATHGGWNEVKAARTRRL